MDHTVEHDVQPIATEPHEMQGEPEKVENSPSRRNFLRSVATIGAGLALAPTVTEAADASKPLPKVKDLRAHMANTGQGQTMKAAPGVKPPNPVKPKPPVAAAPKPSDIKIAMIGPGNQGRNLLTNCLRVPGVRFVAVCDIWPYSQQYASGILRAFKQPVNVYSDYQDMLDKEKDLDAVIIATPDWMHAEQTIACLKAGKHVYCEKEMSNDLSKARDMVLAQRETGKLLQIGHQRRSNPRYWHGDSLINHDHTLGHVTHCYGQWNRASALLLGWAKGTDLNQAGLDKYGYETMDRLRNWRWYKKFAGGPIADLGSHQIDIFGWFLRSNPTSVMAVGGSDYPKNGDWANREWYDNIMTMYTYNTPTGPAHAYYQVLNSTSYGNYYEVFNGTNGSLEISEDVTRGLIYPEPTKAEKKWVNDAKAVQSMGQIAILLKVGETLQAGGKKGPSTKKLEDASEKPPHLLHLENFFDAVRANDPKKLTCPADEAYRTAVTVLSANKALASGQRYDFDPDEFTIKA